MAREEAFSDIAKIGGVRPRVINGYVATAAAMYLADPRKGDVGEFVRHFLRWLENADDDHGDRELRRGVLLLVARGVDRHGLTGKEDAARITAKVEDIYNALA